MDITLARAKASARALRTALARQGHQVGHGHCLELVAQQLGFADWNTAAAVLPTGDDRPWIGPPVPILRILDEVTAREFYLDHLGFGVEWEHRFEPGLPLYLRIRRGEALLDLSEHHGDGTGGAAVWIPVDDVHALHDELRRRPHPRLRPAVDEAAPGGPTLDLIDLFGNQLRFCTPGD